MEFTMNTDDWDKCDRVWQPRKVPWWMVVVALLYGAVPIVIGIAMGLLLG